MIEDAGLFMGKVKDYYDQVADERSRWLDKSRYYHAELNRLLRFLVPSGKSVIEVGCGLGDSLSALQGNPVAGMDVSPRMVEVAKQRHPGISLVCNDIQNVGEVQQYDYVIMANLIGLLDDVQGSFKNAKKMMTPRSRLIVTYYSRLWQPCLSLAVKLGLKMPEPQQNWISPADVQNFLEMSGFEVLRKGNRTIVPFYIPLISNFVNRVFPSLPLFRHLCLTTYVVARQRPMQHERRECSVSVIIPTKNEAGNIFGAIERTPAFGSSMEFIFVDGHSTDGTADKIKDVQSAYPDKDITFIMQSGRGKANAVWEAMDAAKGDLLMILDSDLAVPPEELPLFYEVYINGYAEFINGVRLVYAREKEAMRFLNSIANHFFALAFTWILGFRIKDTLCGTKVISREDYKALKANMSYFGDFDPFGDFQLIFGAAKLNLRVGDVPVHYKARTYGEIEIDRWRDGLLLIRMLLYAVRRLKFV